MKKTCLLFLLVVCLFTAFAFLWECSFPDRKATIQEGTEVIKTYPFSDPDPVPILTRSSLWGKGARLYPYFFFEKFSDTGIEKKWNVVRMENPYIKLSILPQVGGKIWGATEKSTNKEFIYTNHVLKFREIALRGPWTSGGIEFNFGIVGHTPSCATPVDYLLRKNRDGSVSCVVGTMDLPSRTRWSVTITLTMDKAFFETRALWYNPSPFNQAYYSWVNAAIKTGDDLQYVIPGSSHIGHNFSVPLKSWPVDKNGRDLSWYKNNNFGPNKSYFTVGEYEDFFGGYWHDLEFGFGHWALYDDIPGQKAWIWALSRQGAIWEDLLTDSDGQYSEPQAGRYLNQSDHAFFTPYTADLWREIWFPYKKIGPMVKASPYGVLNATQNGNSMTVGICPLQKIHDDLVITSSGKELYREHLELKPMEVYEKTLSLNLDGGPFQINIARKLCFSSNPKANDLNRPIHFHNFDEGTPEGLYLAARRLEKERNYYMALKKYLERLEKEPLHTRTLCRIAELYSRRAEYKNALTYARRALKNVMYDPEANYIYGVISRQMGNLVDAKEALGWASRSMEYRSGAYCQLAEISLVEQNFDLALEYARHAVSFNTYNINAHQIMALTYRIMRQPEEARRILDKILDIDPLNHLARFERYLLKPNRENLGNFLSMLRNELPHENYLEISLYYAQLGFTDDALELLRLAPEHPTVFYWIAYLLKDREPRKSKVYLNKASILSPELVFPFREESIPVFKWASESLTTDWKAKYYLGLIYWSKGRIIEALEIFENCGQPDYAPFYLSRAHFYKETSPEKALEDYETAVKVDEESWKTRHYLIDFYGRLGMSDEALSSARKAAKMFPEETFIQIDLVRALMNKRLYEESAAILEEAKILPFEGARDVHSLFVLSHVHLAIQNMKKGEFSRAVQHLEKSKTYPERLGTGRPYNPDLRKQDYLIALCHDRLGDKGKAEENRKAVYDYTLKHWDDQQKNRHFGGLILQYYGEHKKAQELLNKDKPSREVLDVIKMMRR